ncbi:hypothetical protein NHH03_22400 [Stieleria sp. TO1_6]|uniref:hypothetical protein n=1 Tax=Stieleria tagensis TaxID=2956795 RepID=UPI00209ABDBD|nr:hypothetical protein [Stieleria tagensis]MCO8124507.1 hypothetical protein [Stieleria tagensis]
MITTSNQIDKTEGELTQLRSLDEIRQRRFEMHRSRKQSFADAKKPVAPLAVKVAEATKPPKIKIVFTMETLERYDTIHGTVERMAVDQPLDALPIARALLASLLRLSWARVSGKRLTNPAATEVPHKLFLRQAVTKDAMRRLNHAIKKETSASNLLECSRALLVWLASDPESVLQ